MTFKLTMPKKDRGAARFLAQVHAAIANAAAEAKKEHGVTQRQIASELGVDKSAISRILAGAGNPTARSIAEISAVLGYRPELILHEIGDRRGNHQPTVASGADPLLRKARATSAQEITRFDKLATETNTLAETAP